MENINEIVAGITVEMKNINDRLNSLEDLTKSVQSLAISMERLTARQSATEKAVSDMCEDVSELKGKPAKRWEAIVSAVIAAVVSGYIGYLIAMTLK